VTLTQTITFTRTPTPNGGGIQMSIQEAVNVSANTDRQWVDGTPRPITGSGSFAFVAPVMTSTQTTGQANCDTTSDLIFLYDSAIEDGTITHTGLNASGTPTSDGIYLGPDALVTTSSGTFLAAGSSIPLGRSAANQWYGITLAGSVKVTFLRVPRQ
jgi:hypothetical protein